MQGVSDIVALFASYVAAAHLAGEATRLGAGATTTKEGIERPPRVSITEIDPNGTTQGDAVPQLPDQEGATERNRSCVMAVGVANLAPSPLPRIRGVSPGRGGVPTVQAPGHRPANSEVRSRAPAPMPEG